MGDAELYEAAAAPPTIRRNNCSLVQPCAAEDRLGSGEGSLAAMIEQPNSQEQRPLWGTVRKAMQEATLHGVESHAPKWPGRRRSDEQLNAALKMAERQARIATKSESER